MGEEETAPGPTRRDAEGPRFSALRPSLRPESLEVLRSRGFERATPVQAAAIGLLAGNKDVAVEACTGSGKTLAFVLPIVEAINKENPCLRSPLIRAYSDFIVRGFGLQAPSPRPQRAPRPRRAGRAARGPSR